MRVLVQKCKNASVKVDGKTVGKCDYGLLLFVGFTKDDDLETIKYLAKKIVNLRIFEDLNHVMNESVLDKNGSILSVSQFTLYANTSKGNRPSYMSALGGSEAKKLYDLFNEELGKFLKVETGIFGSDMDVSFTNIGPTTIWLEK